MRVRCIHSAGCLMACAMKSQATVLSSGVILVFTTRLKEYIIVRGWAGLICGRRTTVKLPVILGLIFSTTAPPLVPANVIASCSTAKARWGDAAVFVVTRGAAVRLFHQLRP